MTTWRSGFVDASDVRIHYTRTGGDGPALLLAHGVTDDGLRWTPLAQRLEADYDVIMVDARGHGMSSAPEAGYDPGTMAGDLAAVIRALGLDRPFVLGHSMGAITAIAMAGLFPDSAGAILAEDPPPWWMGIPESSNSDFAEIAPRMRAWITGVQSQSVDELVEHQRAETPWWPEGEFRPWAESKLRFDMKGLALFDQDSVTAVDWQAILPNVVCPILLITADPTRGAIVTDDDVARLQELVPGTRRTHIANAGHSIHRDQPEAYFAAIREYLDISMSRSMRG